MANVYEAAILKTEAELEDLLFREPSAIEPGIRTLSRQWNTDRGPLDLLLLDEDGRVVVAELKLGEDDGMLMQGVDYLGWVHENLEAVRRAFEKDFTIATDKVPRLILIASGFSDLLRRRTSYLRDDLEPSLLAYRVIEHKGETLVVLTEVEPAERLEPAAGPAKESDHREYLVGEELRSLWDRCVTALKGLDPQPHATGSYLAFRLKGKNFAVLHPRRQKIVLGALQDGGKWEYTRLKDETDIEKALGQATAAKGRL
jgi:hypothetical protein